ncbi:FAS1 domain-containing protein [Umbelopsis sp. PMI_123]|nr:FAS1 domain-containing protein [Umbelopsis sp. PMI_123]
MHFKPSALAAVFLATTALAQSGNNSIADIISSNSELSTLSALLTNGTFGNFSSVVTTLSNSTNGNWTIFAPSNSAFDGVQITNSTDISSILSYHTVNGTHMTSQFKDGSNILATNLTNSTYDHFPSGGVPVDVKVSNSLVNVYYGANYANVTSADNSASNGVVHIINAVLIPPTNVNGTALQAGLDMFVSILNSTNSTDGINKKSGITIFAPNDDAFNSASLSKYNSSQLANIVAYHVVEGLYFSTNLTNLTSPMNVSSEAGSNFTIDGSGGSIKLTDLSGNQTAHVVKTDILTDNGVIHVIDAVLIPAQNASEVPTNNTKINSGVAFFASKEVNRVAVAMTVVSAFAALML